MINLILLLVVGLIYTLVALVYLVEGKTGLSIVFLAYALANYGLYLAGK